jgi:hypothetical protein
MESRFLTKWDSWPVRTPTPGGPLIWLTDFAHLRELVVLVLAWTIADLGGREVPGRDELAIALAMRHGEQPGAVRREAVGP